MRPRPRAARWFLSRRGRGGFWRNVVYVQAPHLEPAELAAIYKAMTEVAGAAPLRPDDTSTCTRDAYSAQGGTIPAAGIEAGATSWVVQGILS